MCNELRRRAPHCAPPCGCHRDSCYRMGEFRRDKFKLIYGDDDGITFDNRFTAPHRGEVRDLALPQRLDERTDAALVAHDVDRLAGAAADEALAPVAEATARKLAGEDRGLALPNPFNA